MGRGRGGRNTSARPLPQASAYNVPAFASGLGMTLEPIKAAASTTASTMSSTTSTTAPVIGHSTGPASATAPNPTVTLEKVSVREIFPEG